LFSHAAQAIVTGGFGQYDYGPALNLLKYGGRLTPPPYNLSNVNVPVLIFWSNEDSFVVPKVNYNLIIF
jgi:lysosomal acid lipase/cholesteryl ester hydrolase